MYHRIATLIVTSICFSLLESSAYRMFNTDRDLSGSLINQLYQDRAGMMWVSTEDGLNRYDGNKFSIYRNVPGDSTSLCNNYVKAISEDEKGRIYVCTRSGIQIYNPGSDSFSKRLQEADGKEFQEISNNIVRRNKNEYWSIGNYVRRFSIEGPEALVLKPVEGLPIEINNLHCGLTDQYGNLWLSQRNVRLIKITPDNKVHTYLDRSGDPSVTALAVGADGQLYAGTSANGLWVLDFNTDTFRMVSKSTDKEIMALFVDSNGDIAQATDGDGVIIYSPASGKSRHLLFGDSDSDPFRSKVHCLLKDADSNIWMGIYQSGVLMIPHLPNLFGYLGHRSADTNVVGRNCISCIFTDTQGYTWVGADNDGIYCLDQNRVQLNHFKGTEINTPMCFFQDSSGQLWVGTYLQGVGILDRQSGRFKRIDISDGSRNSENNCMAIAEDSENNLWLGMLNNGLMRYNLLTGRLENDFPWRGKISRWIGSLHFSSKTGTLYVGTYNGLAIVSNLSRSKPDIKEMLSDDIIYSIDETPDGMIWLGTSRGLVMYNTSSGTTKRYDMSHGLLTNTVYAVSHDSHNIWMSLNSGITRFDPAKEVFTNFMVDDGLQGNEFYKNSVFRDEDGVLYFGGTDGITYFNPHDISSPGRKWTPRITGFYLRGKSTPTGVPLYEASEIEVGADDNSFAIEFGTRELGRPESVLFAYSIDGNSWERLPAGTNIVNFSNLKSGSHKLRFKVLDGQTESDITAIELKVGYHWYATPWMIAVYFLVVMMIVYWLIHSYFARIRHKAELVELTHAEELNEARLQSFVNISHEIRTPMSLVISPLRKLLASDDNPSRRYEYGLILRNAKRILRLIDEMMDLRKIEKNQMRMRLVPVDIAPMISDICDTFEQAAANKNISLIFSGRDEKITASVDVANFDKILMNLLSNAVKYTPEDGNIEIQLSEEDKIMSISVTDSGIGISDADKERIFERFYQADGNTAGGTGVGLHLTKQLVLLHGGEITVSDNPSGVGTRFTVRIPCGKAVVEQDSPQLPRIVPNPDKKGASLVTYKEWEEPVPEAPRPGASRQLSDTVLVVEDDAEIRQYLFRELSQNYKVETATNGQEALKKIFSNAPDLIVSDIMMPVMDGLQLTKELKRNINLNHIPILLLTALTRDEDNIRATQAGADDYVTKPFNIEVLRSKIASLIERYRSLKNLFSGSQAQEDKLEQLSVSGNDEKLMEKVMAVINREMANPELSVEFLASEVGLSRVHLHRRMKAITNQSPRDFIRNIRLRQAATLLVEKQLNVSEVAYLTGFSNAGSFTTTFKRLFGVTPSEYVERNKRQILKE